MRAVSSTGYPPVPNVFKVCSFGTFGRGAVAKIMYTVYVLKDKNGKLYKGVTNNLTRRLKEHYSGHTITTKRMVSFQVVYQEQYATFDEARNREKYFKTAAGRRFLKYKIKI